MVPMVLKRSAFVGLLALAVACGGDRPTDAVIPEAGVIALSEQFTGNFWLVDAAGAPVTDEDFRGRLQVIYFGFASCPDVCPLALGRLSSALALLNDKDRAAIAPLFITVDPARDTPEIVGAYVENFPGIMGLTGDEAAVEAAKAGFKVYAARRDLPESDVGYTVDHTSFFYLVDRQGAPRYALQDAMTPEEIAAVMKRAIKNY